MQFTELLAKTTNDQEEERKQTIKIEPQQMKLVTQKPKLFLLYFNFESVKFFKHIFNFILLSIIRLPICRLSPTYLIICTKHFRNVEKRLCVEWP